MVGKDVFYGERVCVCIKVALSIEFCEHSLVMSGAVRQGWAVARLCGVTAALLSVSTLYRYTIGRTNAEGKLPLSVFRTVYSYCILILVSLAYYCVCKACVLLCVAHKVKGQRVRSPGTQGKDFVITDISTRYSRSQTSPGGRDDMGSVSEPGSGHSSLSEVRLNIRNVWVLVYGLGFVIFITGYCFMGLHPVCLSFIGFAIGVLCVDELLCPRSELRMWYLTARSIVLFLVMFSLVSVSMIFLESTVTNYVKTLDIYSMVFGMIFPFASQFILILIRDIRRYSLGTVIEVCEFGFPFTAFLGVFHLCVAYGQLYQSDKDGLSGYEALQSTVTGASAGNFSSAPLLDYSHWYHFNQSMVGVIIWTDAPFLTFYAVAPLCVLPCVVCYMASVLDGRAIDPLLSITLFLCIDNVGGGSSMAVVGTVLCSLGALIRIICEYHPPLLQGEMFSLQTESTQLPHNVVWRRQTTMRDCEAETQELSVDFPDEVVVVDDASKT